MMATNSHNYKQLYIYSTSLQPYTGMGDENKWYS